MRKWLIDGMLLALVGMFVWTRIYQLPETFDLFGDSARDLLELEEWRVTGKPPLLGPHTSAISFNQSAWYFYYLYPFYLLSGQSLYTTQIAIIFWYLAWLGVGYKWGERYGLTKDRLILLWAIIAFHPLLIDQTRTVWNPSLILPLLIAALLVQLFWIRHEATLKEIGVWASLLVFAVGCSYSVIPAAGLMALLGIIAVKKRVWMAAMLIIAVLIVNIGTIGYEIKYGFLLTKNLPNQQVLQTSVDYAEKLQLLGQFISGIRR
jgi:hypothetical protein